jgi:hypothetical protein
MKLEGVNVPILKKSSPLRSVSPPHRHQGCFQRQQHQTRHLEPVTVNNQMCRVSVLQNLVKPEKIPNGTMAEFFLRK